MKKTIGKKLIAMILAVMVMVISCSAAWAQAPAAGLPDSWDLEQVYASVDEWQADYDTVMEMLNQYEDFRGNLNNAETIYDYFQFGYLTELTQLQCKLYLYAELGYYLNPTDPVYATLLAQLDNMTVQEQMVSAFAEPEIFELSLEEREEIFSDPIFEGMEYWLQSYTDPMYEPLTEGEAMVQAIMSLGYGYANEIFDILNDVEIPDPEITMPDGSVEPLTDELYYEIIYSPEYDDEFKAEANQVILTKPIPYINTFASLLEENASQAYAAALLANYYSTRECALDVYDVDPAIYDMLIEAAHAGCADYQRYLKAHAAALGLEEQYPYQMGTYVSDFDPGLLEYDDAVAEVTDALSILGEEYIDTFMEIMESGHIDVYPTETKTSGAFETQPSNDYLPWLLFNYIGYSDDVSTIAHEMGHAVYDTFSTRYQPAQYSSPTIFTQEVASTTNELLYYTYKMNNAADDDEKLFYLENMLSMFSGTFFTQMWFAEFEDYFYQEVEAGYALDAEELSDKWMELTDEYRGDAIIAYPDYRYYWATIPHFYYVYYVYQYAAAVAYAASIAERITSGEEGAVEEYLAFLKLGGSAAPDELLAVAGVDPLSEETYQYALEYFAGLVDEYERLIAER